MANESILANDAWSAFLIAIFQTFEPQVKKLLSDELRLPNKVREELESLATVISMIHAYLRDTAQKQETNEAVRLWLIKLQDVAYDANDLLDECEFEAQRQKVIPLARIRNTVSAINPVRRIFLHTISNKMRRMKKKMEEIKKHRRDYLDYGLWEERERPPIPVPVPVPRNESSSLGPPVFIGRDDDKRRLIDLLLAGKSSTSVICVVGMGGVGKTALAQHVYNDEHVRGTFRPMSWVYVSQDFKGERLTKDILESIDGVSQDSATLDILQKGLLNKLRGKKYLLVLDDVWIEDWRLWYNFSFPLLQGAMGSKILVTTRTNETAKAMGGASIIHPLEPIRDEDCCSLFFNYMHRLNPNISVEDLQRVSRVIAKKCNGLPSAAADLAFRLFQESDRSRWCSILETESLLNSDRFQEDLSYQLLPPRLKQCFALCSVFPNGFEFDKEELVHLWMAQNFIQHSDDQRMEDVGSTYFDLFERKSLLQYSRFDRMSNRSKYNFHNSIHDLARSASRGECVIAKPGQGIGKARHLSLMCHEVETYLTIDQCDQVKCLYTLVVFGDCIAKLPGDFTRKLKNLRALDLSNTILQKLPDSINHLKHLRYLQLRGTKIRRLPDALSELYFLQTLGLRNCYKLEELPRGIRYLQKLRHIDLHRNDDSMLMMAQEDISWSSMGSHSLRFMPPEIGLLNNLQTLTRFVVSEKSGCGLEELENLNQLHGELLVSNLHLVQRAAEATKANLKAKQNLQCLGLHWADVGEETLNYSRTFQRRDKVERILCELQPHDKLRGLRIVGYMGISFPNWFGPSYFCNLTSLTLVNCKQCFSLPPLGNLPLLTELHIEGMDEVRYVNCEFCIEGNAMPFRALKKLQFKNMRFLEQWCGNNGCAFNALGELVIKNCLKLEKITHDMPSLEKLVIENTPGLAFLPNLQSLHSLEMTRSGELLWKLFSSLTSLQSLSLTGLSTEYLPAELQYGLNSLQRLEINSWNELERFPNTWPPNNLVYFGVKNCPKLRFLPDDIEKLQVLEDMEIQGCPQLLSLPEQVGYLKSLVRLDMSNCTKLTSLPSFLPNTLQILSISNCPMLKEGCKLEGKYWTKIRNIFSLWIDGKKFNSPLSQGESSGL